MPIPPLMFLDQRPDEKRLRLATALSIAVVHADDESFVLLNPDGARPCLTRIFGVQWSSDWLLFTNFSATLIQAASSLRISRRLIMRTLIPINSVSLTESVC